jgi:Type I restriction modification DNA specificity domain
MQKSLQELASITTGVYQKASPSGDTFYLQGKHFDEQGKLREDVFLTPELQMDRKLKHHLLEDSDILLMAKGESNRACLFESHTGNAVASSIFIIIRLKSRELSPKFLQWYLNTPQTQNILAGQSRGTHTLSLSKGVLESLEVPVPTLEVQHKILVVHELWQREKMLQTILLHEKEIFYQSILVNLTKTKSQ